MFPPLTGTTSDGVLTYAHQTDIRKAWPVILSGVQAIREANGEPWLPEDIYTALVTGRAGLYTFQDSQGVHAGFGVYSVMTLEYEANPVLNIWLGHAEKKEYGHYGVELSRLIGGAMGLERIVFSTSQENSWVKKFRLFKAYYEVT